MKILTFDQFSTFHQPSLLPSDRPSWFGFGIKCHACDDFGVIVNVGVGDDVGFGDDVDVDDADNDDSDGDGDGDDDEDI